jgi:predicted metalloprotease with PDZ domain
LASAVVSEGEISPGLVRISLGEQPVFGFYDWRLVVLHEVFHLWNAGSFRYVSGAEQWFNEGITEFYTMQTAARLKLIAPLQAVDIAATSLGFYGSASDFGTISLTRAASTPDLKFRNYFLVYNGGWMAGLVLDHDIRARTNGRKSLDDPMRRMYENFDRGARLYSTDAIVAQLKAATRPPAARAVISTHETLTCREFSRV